MSSSQKLLNGLADLRILKFFAKYRVLIIDEIGYIPIDLDSAN